jgi:hypothetical protein
MRDALNKSGWEYSYTTTPAIICARVALKLLGEVRRG